MVQKFNEASEQYRADTNRRVKAGEKEFPEGDENMLDHTKRTLQKVRQQKDCTEQGKTAKGLY